MNEQPTAKWMYWSGVVLSTLISLFLLMPANMMLTGAKQVKEGMAQYGFPDGCFTYIGAALLVSIVLYAIPRTAALGAILLTGYLGGAVVTHVRAGEAIFFVPVIFGALVWIALFLRDARVRQLLPYRQ